MAVGIRTFHRMAANIAVTSSTTLVTTGLTVPVAISQIIHVRVRVVFSVGATGGIRFQWVVPAAPTNFLNSIVLRDNVTPATISAVQTSSAAFTNALAAAGNHFIDMEFDLENGATAGNADLQFAQNTSDVLTLTAFRGSECEVTYCS